MYRFNRRLQTIVLFIYKGSQKNTLYDRDSSRCLQFYFTKRFENNVDIESALFLHYDRYSVVPRYEYIRKIPYPNSKAKQIYKYLKFLVYYGNKEHKLMKLLCVKYDN